MNYSEAVKQTLRKTFPKHLAYNCLIMSILGNYNIQFCNSHSNSHPVTISLKIICFKQLHLKVGLMCSKERIHLKISLWGLLSGFFFFFHVASVFEIDDAISVYCNYVYSQLQ